MLNRGSGKRVRRQRVFTKAQGNIVVAQRLAFSRSPGEEEQDKPDKACSHCQMVKSPRQGCRLQRGVGLPESVTTNERRATQKGPIEISVRRFANKARSGSPRMTARRAEQTRRLANRTHTKTCLHATAAQRFSVQPRPWRGQTRYMAQAFP